MYTNAERLVDFQIILGATVVLLIAYGIAYLARIRQSHNAREAVRRANARALRRAGSR